MSLGTILLIVIVIALLGGFSGVRWRPVLRDWLLGRRRPWPRVGYRADSGFVGKL